MLVLDIIVALTLGLLTMLLHAGLRVVFDPGLLDPVEMERRRTEAYRQQMADINCRLVTMIQDMNQKNMAILESLTLDELPRRK